MSWRKFIFKLRERCLAWITFIFLSELQYPLTFSFLFLVLYIIILSIYICLESNYHTEYSSHLSSSFISCARWERKQNNMQKKLMIIFLFRNRNKMMMMMVVMRELETYSHIVNMSIEQFKDSSIKNKNERKRKKKS